MRNDVIAPVFDAFGTVRITEGRLALLLFKCNKRVHGLWVFRGGIRAPVFVLFSRDCLRDYLRDLQVRQGRVEARDEDRLRIACGGVGWVYIMCTPHPHNRTCTKERTRNAYLLVTTSVAV